MKLARYTVRLILASLPIFILGAGCNSQKTTQTPVAPGCSNCSDVTPDSFVAALVQLGQAGTIPSGYSGTKLVKEVSAQPGYFVIWNGASQSYQAVHITAYSASSCNATPGCSDINPQEAAEAYVGAKTTSIDFPVATTRTTSGGVTVSKTTYVTGSEYIGAWGTSPGGGDTYSLAVQPTGQLDNQANPVFQDGYGDGIAYSMKQRTKDVDLQRAEVQNDDFQIRAANISAAFQMDFDVAIQVVQISDKMAELKSNGNGLTDGDRKAMTQAMEGITGTNSDEINDAVNHGLKGDMSVANDLFNKVAGNLGMPSGVFLRDQILPKLGPGLN